VQRADLIEGHERESEETTLEGNEGVVNNSDKNTDI
jgi:hypothetical protein